MNNEQLKLKMMKELEQVLITMQTLSPDTEEYAQAAKNAETLQKMILEFDSKSEDKTDKKKDRWIRIALGVAGLGLTGWQIVHESVWLRRGLRFEETGTFSSLGVRNVFNGVFRRKK